MVLKEKQKRKKTALVYIFTFHIHKVDPKKCFCFFLNFLNMKISVSELVSSLRSLAFLEYLICVQSE